MEQSPNQDISHPEAGSLFGKVFRQALSPIEEFIHEESSSGIVLMICALAAIIIANSPLYPMYDRILHTRLTIGGGDFVLSHSLQHWINDGLMVLFFFVIGLEVKREILIGELSDFKAALLPISAALGGMVMPAAFYLLFNNSGAAVKGWGIPMATDIAFAVGIIALLGSRVPKALVAMLLALAIVDDIGAVLVIAGFYTESINTLALTAAGVFLLLMVGANLSGVRRPLPYVILGIGLWVAMLESGVHATLAGVLAAFTIPARSQADPGLFTRRMDGLTEEFRQQIGEPAKSPGLNVLRNARKQAILQSMEDTVHQMESPLQRMIHSLHGWVSFGIVPVFALANAGIPIDFSKLGGIMVHPVTLGVMSGLLLGKAIGIYGSSWLVLKLGLSRLPKGVTLSQIFGISLLAGIGFTMAIFIDTLAFENQPELLLNAKIGIVFASLAAGISGYIWLLKTTRPVDQIGK
jgi:NhaA family Na+:H+ antiporter